MKEKGNKNDIIKSILIFYDLYPINTKEKQDRILRKKLKDSNFSKFKNKVVYRRWFTILLAVVIYFIVNITTHYISDRYIINKTIEYSTKETFKNKITKALKDEISEEFHNIIDEYIQEQLNDTSIDSSVCVIPNLDTLAYYYAKNLNYLENKYKNKNKKKEFLKKIGGRSKCVSVAFDVVTCELYVNSSGFNYVYSVYDKNGIFKNWNSIHPYFQNGIYDKAYYTNISTQPPESCAEFKVVNEALHDGSDVKNLKIATYIRNYNGIVAQPIHRCNKCLITTNGCNAITDEYGIKIK